MRQAIPIIAAFTAVLAMALILFNGLQIQTEFEIPVAIILIVLIGAFSIIGLFEKSIMKYAMYSAIIQFCYFMLDVSTAWLIDKSIWFAILQLINFIIAGGLFAIVVSILYTHVKKRHIREYAGLYDKNQFLVLALCVSCLALGGLPGFNIFVGEFLIYAALFTIHPAIMVLAVFAGLLCFLFYFRICYVMFAGTVKTKIKLGLAFKVIMGILTIAIVLLGLIPHILLKILEWYV